MNPTVPRLDDLLDATGVVRALSVLRIALGPIVFIHLQDYYRDSLDGTLCCRGGGQAALLNADTLRPLRVPATLFEDNDT